MVAHYAVADEIAIATSVAHATCRLLSATDEFGVLRKPATFEGDNAICPLDNKCLARKVQRRSRRIQGLFCCQFRGSELFPIARDSHQSPPGALGHVRTFKDNCPLYVLLLLGVAMLEKSEQALC